jgi:hypothetical protein
MDMDAEVTATASAFFLKLVIVVIVHCSPGLDWTQINPVFGPALVPVYVGIPVQFDEIRIMG